MSEYPISGKTIQELLDRLRTGDESAREALIAIPMDRLRGICQAILKQSPRVHRWEDTDDLLQAPAVRLWQALQNHHPETPTAFFGLAGVCARRELIDLSRKLYGPHGIGANHASRLIGTGDSRPERHPHPVDPGTDPGELAIWSEFHEHVERLPEADKILFDLLWYQGLSVPEAAAILDLPERTLRRRWRDVRIKLDGVLHGPDSETPP